MDVVVVCIRLQLQPIATCQMNFCCAILLNEMFNFNVSSHPLAHTHTPSCSCKRTNEPDSLSIVVCRSRFGTRIAIECWAMTTMTMVADINNKLAHITLRSRKEYVVGPEPFVIMHFALAWHRLTGNNASVEFKKICGGKQSTNLHEQIYARQNSIATHFVLCWFQHWMKCVHK